MEKTIDQMREEVLAECERLTNGIAVESHALTEINEVYIRKCPYWEDCLYIVTSEAYGLKVNVDNEMEDSGWTILYRLLGLDARVKDAEIDRLRGMLEAVVSHAKEPAMNDELFRQFAIENCEYTLKGGE